MGTAYKSLMRSILNTKSVAKTKNQKNVTYQDVEQKDYNYIMVIPYPYSDIYNPADPDNHNISIHHISTTDKLYAKLVTEAVGDFHITLFDPLLAHTYGIRRLITVNDRGEIRNGEVLLDMKKFRELIQMS